MILSESLRRMIVDFLKRVNPRGYEEQDALVRIIRLLEKGKH